MGKRTLTILLAIILINIVLSEDVKANKTSLDVDLKLKLLNKPAVKSIKVSSYKNIACLINFSNINYSSIRRALIQILY